MDFSTAVENSVEYAVKAANQLWKVQWSSGGRLVEITKIYPPRIFTPHPRATRRLFCECNLFVAATTGAHRRQSFA
ncbi:hypothetical protein ACNQTB_04655 [Corynebacterium diphtheriae]